MNLKRPNPKYANTMLIDDSEIDNFINQKMIEANAFSEKIYVHTSGKSALEFLKNLEKSDYAGQQLIPDIIFLDINMPIMDGFQFVEEFEKLPLRFREKTKIIMLTTSINPSDRDRSRQRPGILKFLNKPLTAEQLAEL